MKVLTIKQPYASLIAHGFKKYEFRTWKTKYRGELYIHTGKSTVKEKMKLVSDYNLEYPNGYIIAKVNLVDCILVDEKMNEELKKGNDKVYTHNYTNSYAWVFKDVEILKNPIKVNGKLSIWNYDE